MTMQDTLEQKLRDAFSPAYLDIVNESHMHAGPAADSHFKVVIAAEAFAGKRLVQRHQLVYAQLQDLLAGSLHALALHTYTPEEWQAKGQAPATPKCMGKKPA